MIILGIFIGILLTISVQAIMVVMWSKEDEENFKDWRDKIC